MTIFGYLRISTPRQSFKMQRDAMDRAGVTELVDEVGSDLNGRQLVALDELCARLVQGDELIVWRIDRLGRERGPLIMRIDALISRGVTVRSLTEGIATDTSIGELLACYQALHSHNERTVLRQRTRAGMAAAKAANIHVGRRPALSRVQRAEVVRMVVEEGRTQGEAARIFEVSASTISRILKRDREDNQMPNFDDDDN